MLHFINITISYSLADKLLSENIKHEAPVGDVLLSKYISHKAPSMSLDKTNVKFALVLYKNSNTIVFKTQVHFSLHNVIYFKYGTAVNGKCEFDCLCPCIDKTRVIELGSIEIYQNHPWINP